MPQHKLYDAGGNSLTVLEVDGKFLSPAIQEDNFRTLSTWKAREDDILICSYPKSGIHWVWEVVSMLVAQSSKRVAGSKDHTMLEMISQNQFNGVPSARVLNTHLLFSEIPEDLLKKKCKIIWLTRNPKDAAVSFYNLHQKMNIYNYDGTWEDYLPMFLKGDVDFGGYFEYMPEWERAIQSHPEYPVHLLSYEDLTEDGLTEVRKLAEFLGVPSNDELFREIVAECSFAKMKAEKGPMERRDWWKDGGTHMFRKGIVGDWKNWFTVAQNEMFDALYDEKVKGSTIPTRFELKSRAT